MLQLRAAAGCLWWRPSAHRGERALTAALVAAIVCAWVALAVLALSAAGGSSTGSSAAGAAAGVPGLRGLSDERGMDGMGDIGGVAGMGGMAGMGGSARTAGMAGMAGMAGPSAPTSRHSMLLGMSFAPAMEMWALMVLAMMLPTALPAIRHVAANTLRRRRARAMSTFTAVYVAIWLAVGVLVMAVAPAWSALDGGGVAASALVLAAGWQFSVHKRRALRDCHRPSPLPPTGSRATAGVVRFALRNGTACVGSCWAMMLAMAVATTATTFWMVAITGVVLTEKLALKPRQATHAGAVLLAAGSLVVAAGALI